MKLKRVICKRWRKRYTHNNNVFDIMLHMNTNKTFFSPMITLGWWKMDIYHAQLSFFKQTSVVIICCDVNTLDVRWLQSTFNLDIHNAAFIKCHDQDNNQATLSNDIVVILNGVRSSAMLWLMLCHLYYIYLEYPYGLNLMVCI